MKLVYYSSVLNHHQKCLCDEFYKYYGDDFKFITTMQLEEQRISLGYKPETAPYLFESFKNEKTKRQAIEMAIEADVFLAGVFPVEILYERMRRNKLTFRHIETYFKSGKYKIFSPNALRIAFFEHTRYRNKQLYLLCASSYVANDVKFFAGYPNKKFRWGYFPETSKVLDEQGINTEKKNIEIMWAGRLIGWKKPQYALRLASDLKKKGISFHLSIVGNGPLEKELKDMAKTFEVQEQVTFCGSMAPIEVRKHMQASDVYLFTSTREEGWGAVLNEAMSCGCAVVASAEAGSTNYLIPNEKFGLKYSKNKYSELLEQTIRLCQNNLLLNELKFNAKDRIDQLWNYKVAASRFVEISNKLLNSEKVDFDDDGPMSKA